MRNKLSSILVGVAAVLSLAGVAVAVDTTVRASGGDCGPNSVVKCGVANTNELVAALRAYPQLMTRYGMTRDSKAVEGSVTKSGDVIVGGKVIATGAHSVGRQYMPGSRKITADGQAFYDRATSVSFNSASLPAYVFVKSDGTFSGAVIKDCGNPVAATPKVTPKPTPTPTPTPSPQYTCDSLSMTRINNSKSRYSYTVKASAKNGATIKDYNFTFGDGSSATSTTPTVTHEYAKAGAYTTSVSVNFTANGKTVAATSPACQVSIVIAEEPRDIQVCDITAKKIVTIKENEYDSTRHTRDFTQCQEQDMRVCVLETKKITTIKKSEYDSKKHSTVLADCDEKPAPVPTPTPTPTPTPPAPVAELPQTGVVDALGGVIGIGSVVASSLYYRASRRIV